MFKLKKSILKTLKGILVGYNNYTIYNIYFKDYKKTIQVINLHILKDYKSKSFTKLLNNSKSISTFQCFFL